jgi:hypothetical protein
MINHRGDSAKGAREVMSQNLNMSSAQHEDVLLTNNMTNEAMTQQ